MSVAVKHERAAEALPLRRLEALCDPGSLELIRTAVVSARMSDRRRPGDGVLAGAGRVGGHPVFCYAQDPTHLGGSLGEAHADTIVRVMELAGQRGAPVVGFVESGRSPAAGGTRGAGRLRADLPPQRPALRASFPRSRSSPASPRAAALTRPL